MRVYAQLVGIGTPDSFPSVMVVTDAGRYMFNVGEGLQRFCMEHKMRLVKLEHILFTQINSDACGGLPGLLLTLADMGRKRLQIHGPRHLTDYMYGFRNFMRRDDVTISTQEVCHEHAKPCKLGDLMVTPILTSTAAEHTEAKMHALLSSKATAAFKLSKDALEIHEPFNPWTASTWPDEKMDKIPAVPAVLSHLAVSETASAVRACVSYILETETIIGKFHPDRAQRFGIKPGPAYGKLTKGEHVVSTIEAATAAALGYDMTTLVIRKGRVNKGSEEVDVVDIVVRPEMVKDPDVPGQFIGIFDAMNEVMAAKLEASSAIQPFLSDGIAQPHKAFVVAFHFCSEDVYCGETYTRFMNRLAPTTQHVWCRAEAMQHDGLPSAAILNRAQAVQLCKLHALQPNAFAIPYPLHHTIAAHAARLDASSLSTDTMQALCTWRWSRLECTTNTAKDYVATDTSATSTLPLDIKAPLLHKSASRCTGAPKPLQIHHIIPLHAIAANPDYSTVVQEIHPFEPIDEMYETPDLVNCLRTLPLRTEGPSHASRTECANSWPKQTSITFTGTSSAIPSKYRNVSGILYTVGDKSMLLDGGEGTVGQLYRKFGNAPAFYDALTSIQCVWISHMHADHHLGIIKLIRLRAQTCRKRGESPALLVVGPSRLYHWLLESTWIDQDLVGAWQFVDAEHFLTTPVGTPIAETAVSGTPLRPDVTCWSAAKKPSDTPSGLVAGADADDRVVEASPLCAPGCETRRLGIDALMPQPHAKLFPIAHDAAFVASEAFIQRAFEQLSLVNIRVTRVQHCFKAYGIRLAFQRERPWSVVYSGDTRPCEELVALARGRVTAAVDSFADKWWCAGKPMHDNTHTLLSTCDILIHEATFDDTDPTALDNAYMKKHSTAEEACCVSEAMEAAYTILTHFSARYPKLPALKHGKDRLIFVAYDLMTVDDNIHELPSLLPALHLLFAEDVEEVDNDTTTT